MKQTQLIMNYMREHGSISNREAVIDLGVDRLASRIHELRQMGIEIETDTDCRKNRYGETTHFARYRLL